MGIKGRGRSGTNRDSNPACLCCSSAHLVQCEPDEASSFTNPNVGPGTYASLRLKLDAWSSAVQRGQKCSSPTRRLPSRSWGPIRPRVCSWFRAPIRHECQTAQLKSRGASQRNEVTIISLTPTPQRIYSISYPRKNAYLCRLKKKWNKNKTIIYGNLLLKVCMGIKYYLYSDKLYLFLRFFLWNIKIRRIFNAKVIFVK